MSAAFLLNQRSLAYAEDYVPTPDPIRVARDEAITSGAPAPSNGLTTALTFLARVLDARAVVEVGTGAGVTGLALFQGMNEKGVLTSIDPEVGWQLTAKQAFQANRIPSQRFRLIAGRPLEVLNNLRDGAYDIVLVNTEKLEYVEHVAQAERLLRPGGLLLLNDALWRNLVADAEDESDESVIIREALESINDSEVFTACLLPIGEGLLAAVKSS
ncbi:MAG: class I SAM-dependent methyltransferase [Brooklawnia sp.]|uniref:O-methyltransferase n=1 Tax=Brooklawnia sp. TaxID=2699740 RepID=UPI003C785149